jgi:hypothetical protein
MNERVKSSTPTQSPTRVVGGAGRRGADSTGFAAVSTADELGGGLIGWFCSRRSSCWACRASVSSEDRRDEFSSVSSSRVLLLVPEAVLAEVDEKDDDDEADDPS